MMSVIQEFLNYLVDDFGFKGGNNAGVVKLRELLKHVMKH